MVKERYLYCKYCDWKTLKWFRRKSGLLSTPAHAFNKLIHHIEDKHPEKSKKHEKRMEHLRLTNPYEDENA